MSLGRLARASLHTRLHAPYSSFASTSRSTLDDPLPLPALPLPLTPWHALAPTPRAPPPTATPAPPAGCYLARRRARRLERLAVRLPPLLAAPAATATPRRNPADPLHRPPNDRAQISPFLPLPTRERSHLLHSFRHALWSRSSPLSSSSRRAKQRTKHYAQAWNPDQVWVGLARVLKYPEEVPQLPRSHFPSSLRSSSGSREGASEFDTSEGGGGGGEVDENGFFTSSRTTPSPSSSLAAEEDPSGRTPISLSLPELKRSFTVLSSARPRTRTGLNRLLVVAELIARKKGAVLAPTGPSASAEEFTVDRAGGDETELRGGGLGLSEKDWTALILFSASCLRTTRPEPDMKIALSLFSQYLALNPSTLSPPPPSPASSSPSAPSPSPSLRRLPPRRRASLRALYNALLHLCVRARMYELYERVLVRRRAAGFADDANVGDVAFVAEEVKREVARGGGVQRLWEVWSGGVRGVREVGRRRIGGGGEGGDERLWALLVWVLARQGRMEDAMRVYRAMRGGREIELGSLQPVEDEAQGGATELLSPSSASPTPSPSTSTPYLLTPPPLTDPLYTSLLQSFSHTGNLSSALLILRDLIRSSLPPSALSPNSRRRKHATVVHPMPHHFLPLFRAFATFGMRSTTGGGGGSVEKPAAGLERTMLRSRGGKDGSLGASRAVSRSTAPLASLVRSGSPYSSSDTASGGGNPFTLPALDSLLDSFLSLSAPPSSLRPSLPFMGQRTAPTPQTLWWVLFAFEKLSGGDEEVVVGVWKRLEEKFGGGGRVGGGEGEGWTGWRPGKRVRELVQKHVDKREEMWRRWEELN